MMTDARQKNGNMALLLAASSLGAFALFLSLREKRQQQASSIADHKVFAEEQTNEYTLDEVAKHKTAETGIWVTYKDCVYDITSFVAVHPGGTDKIMLAAGGSIDPFWDFYTMHTNDDVQEILEEYKIGRLTPGDAEKKAHQLARSKSAAAVAYADDPARLPVFAVHSERPFNAETPLDMLAEDFITPNEYFFVRNHLPVPRIEPEQYELVVAGNGVNETKLTLEELKSKFPQHTVVTTIQCAGNRRTEMNKARQVKGLEWQHGAISTAEWTGVRLRDVLKYAGLDPESCEDDPRVQHIQVEGYDKDPMGGSVYGGSIPAYKALDSRGDVLLAFTMNGQDIPRDHGYPVRLIVPGVVGARNVKWVNKLIVSEQESKNHFQQKDYKSFSPAFTSMEQLDYNKGTIIQELPVQSAICHPKDGSMTTAGDSVTVKGYAWSGGGKDIIRVDVTQDGGKTWQEAELKKLEQKPGRAWAWTLFEAKLPVAGDQPQQQPLRVCSKATDAAMNTQPESSAPIWNARGFLTNVWSCIDVHVKRD